MAKNCSSHNLLELDEIISDLEKNMFALETLISHEWEGFDFPPEFNFWLCLLMERLSMTSQGVHDLSIWQKCLRSETDMNSDCECDSDASV